MYKLYVSHEKLIGQVSIAHRSRVMAATADTKIRHNCRRLHLPFVSARAPYRPPLRVLVSVARALLRYGAKRGSNGGWKRSFAIV